MSQWSKANNFWPDDMLFRRWKTRVDWDTERKSTGHAIPTEYKRLSTYTVTTLTTPGKRLGMTIMTT